MNPQSEHELATRIGRLLNQGADQLDADISAKLLNARKEALAHYQNAQESATTLAWAGGGQRSQSIFGRPHWFNLRMAALTAIFAAAVVCALAWQSYIQGGSELAEVDAGLLTDDLPINAYLDRGFDSWLKRHAP